MNHLRAQWRLAMAGVDPNAELAFEDRLGNCYEFAARYALDNPGSTLIHGSIEGMGNPRIGHAWVVDADGEVFEPTSGQHYDPLVFKQFFKAEVTKSYHGVEINRAAVRSGHWGPWHDQPWGLEASKVARNIKGKDWYEEKENGKVVAEVFDPWWDSQHEQYPLKGSPGITYRQEKVRSWKINCLLYYDKDGDLVGILNHFPQDMPPHQKAGDSLTVVAPGVQRQGIGTKLLGEALKRWPDMNLHQPENSAAGNALVRSMGR